VFFTRFIIWPALAIRSFLATIGSLMLVLPLGITLIKAVGVPLLIVMLILGAPLLILLAVLGLPIIIVLAIALVALMALPAIFAVGAIALKIFLFVVLPIWLLVKAIRWVLKPRDGDNRDWTEWKSKWWRRGSSSEAAPPEPPPPPNTATGDI
jgi:hypothetical protein